jgi:hypothetical protein
MAKNLSIVAQGISGDAGHLLGYNVTDNGIYTPAIGDVARDTTATYVAQDGTIKTAQENVARVDYTNGVAELLLEPTSTNLITYSEDFSEWSLDSGMVLNSGFLSPDGTNNAYSLSTDSDTSSNQLKKGGLDVGGTNKDGVASVYIKGSFEGQEVKLTLNEEGISAYTISVNVTTEWKRYEITNTTTTGTSFSFRITPATSNDLIYIFGAQLEQQSYATSYIPTNGAIATRGADSLTNFGSEQIIDSESGILFFEGSALVNGGGNDRRISLGDGTQNNRVFFDYRGDGTFRIFYTANGVGGVVSYSLNQNELLKLGIKYNTQGVNLFVNGNNVGQDNKIISFSNLNSLSFTDSIQTFNPFYGRVRQVKHLPYNTDITTL